MKSLHRDQVCCISALPESEFRPAEVDGLPQLRVQILRPIDLTETHGADVTIERLQELVQSYDPTIEEASLTFDHQWDGPSWGWCIRLELEGEILVAIYRLVHASAVEEIVSGKWRRCSAEIARRHKVTGGWYFTGLALLGARSPAVPGLQPVSLHRERGPFTEVHMSTPSGPAAPDPPTPAPVAPASPTPPATPAPELTAMLARAQQDAAALRQANAAHQADAAILRLGNRCTPAMARDLRPLLVSLYSAETTQTIRLAAENGTSQEVTVAAAIERILSNVPEFQALGTPPLANPVADPEIQASGLPPERVTELERKFKFSRGYAFGSRAN